jgi:ubiquinone/menaquinone biosynthesis C-methylase UbiE
LTSVATSLRPILGDIHGGRLLDVATGRGGLIPDLIDGLSDFDAIVGVDAAESARPGFEAAFADRRSVTFELRDAYRLGFDDGSFDGAALGSSLHHFADPAAVLVEMRRVVRPGGWLVIVEMYRERQPPAEQTHVQLHTWCAAIDTLGGTVHRETFTRAEIVDLIERAELTEVKLLDVADDRKDPLDPDFVGQVEAIIDRYLGLAAGHPELEARGEEVRKLLRANGMRNAKSVAAVGRVRSPKATLRRAP